VEMQSCLQTRSVEEQLRGQPARLRRVVRARRHHPGYCRSKARTASSARVVCHPQSSRSRMAQLVAVSEVANDRSRWACTSAAGRLPVYTNSR
jgi:hypothetical protein